ncbi:unnamed protein product [Knipowitschia caucasica]|uniref:Ig-like domain-containing protein n=1 Tax=Knipowitschia caucasica TaxID=637954 RepID=A0AAV2KKF4_KNICA
MWWPTFSLLWLLACLLKTPAASAHLKVVTAGDDVTLECSFGSGSVAVMFYWYKQVLGQKPVVMSRFSKHNKASAFLGEFKRDPRLSLKNKLHQNHLTISDSRQSDSATYFCISGYSYMYEFETGVALVVRGRDLSVETQTEGRGRAGGSLVLRCLVRAADCDGRREVYWVKEVAGRLALVTYAGDGGCVKSVEDSKTCVSLLRVGNMSSEQTGTEHTGTEHTGTEHTGTEHTGTYHCAVAACGQVLLGNGTTVVLEDVSFVLELYFLCGSLVVGLMLVLLLGVSALTMIRTRTTQGPGLGSASVRSGIRGRNHGDAVRLNQRDGTWSECVYSEVHQ